MNLNQQISPNEQVLWSGRKATKVSVLEAIFNPMLPFALIWFLFDLGFILSTRKFSNIANEVFSQNQASSFNGGFMFNGFFAIFFVLHLMPVWIYLAGIVTCFYPYWSI